MVFLSLSQVTSIFTSTEFRRGHCRGQLPNHYAFRAGQNLPDKESRYLRTVMDCGPPFTGVRCFILLFLRSLNLPALGEASALSSSFDLAETYVFVKKQLGRILCDWLLHQYPFFQRDYGVNLPSS